MIRINVYKRRKIVLWKSYFNKIIKYDQEESYVYGYLGYALINLLEFEKAEKYLVKANIIYVEIPLIWAILIIFDLNNNKILKVIKCYNKINIMMWMLYENKLQIYFMI